MWYTDPMLVVAVMAVVIACFCAGATAVLIFGVYLGYQELKATRSELAVLKDLAINTPQRYAPPQPQAPSNEPTLQSTEEQELDVIRAVEFML